MLKLSNFEKFVAGYGFGAGVMLGVLLIAIGVF